MIKVLYANPDFVVLKPRLQLPSIDFLLWAKNSNIEGLKAMTCLWGKAYRYDAILNTIFKEVDVNMGIVVIK